MSDDADIEPPDPALAARYAAERAAPVTVPGDAQARVLLGVLARIAAPPPPPPPPSAGPAASTAAAGKAAAVATPKVVALVAAGLAVGAGAGVAGDRAWAPRARVDVATPAPVRVGTADAAPAPTPDAPRAAPVPDAAAPARTRPAAAAAAPSTGDADPEPLLVDRARAALRRGLTDDALVTLMEHERRFPSGALAEERDVLVIEAYVAKGDARLTAARIERYRRDHPRGYLRAKVDALAAGQRTR